MKCKRHAVLCVPLPPGFVRTLPEEIPPEYMLVPRIALGEAAAVAAKLNADQIAAGDTERKLFLPMKCFDSPRRGRKAKAGRGGGGSLAIAATSAAGSQPSPAYADAPLPAESEAST